MNPTINHVQATAVNNNNKPIAMQTRKYDKSEEIVNIKGDELEKKYNKSTKWLQICLGELVRRECRTPKVINKKFKKSGRQMLILFSNKKKPASCNEGNNKTKQMNERGKGVIK